jgi:hypothetical protein
MINEPVTFGPAVKGIAQESARLSARIRARLQLHGTELQDADSAA